MSLDELRRHYRVIDMMLSMHSALRDRYANRALVADLLLLLLSLVLNAFVFLDPTVLDFLHVNREATRIAVGVSAILVLFLSLVIWRVDWKERAQTHAQAADTLGKLKLDCRGVLNTSATLAEHVDQQIETCAWVLSGLPKVSEADFVLLKAAHKRKVKVSQLVDTYPGTPLWLVRLRMTLQDARRYLRDKGVESPPRDDA